MDTLPACRLLIVDPDREYARRLAGVLARAGHAVETCGGLDEALAAARRAPVDLAIVDPGACEGEGLALARQLGAVAFLAKASDPAACLPAINASLALAVAGAAERGAARAAVSGLERAQGENRAIGFAVGLLMERLCMDRTRAFAALRAEARARRARIADVAESMLSAAELINGLQEPEPTAAQLFAS